MIKKIFSVIALFVFLSAPAYCADVDSLVRDFNKEDSLRQKFGCNPDAGCIYDEFRSYLTDFSPIISH